MRGDNEDDARKVAELEPRCFQVTFVGSDQRGQMRPGTVYHEDDSTGISVIFPDVVTTPAHGPGDVSSLLLM